MIGTERAVTPETLQAEVKRLFDDGYRIVTATCFDQGENFEIIYHFDKNLDLMHLRLVFPKDAEIPSITGSYLAAFLIENEIQELFGVKINGIAVNYDGRMLVTDDSLVTPMLKATPVTSVAVTPNGGEQ